MVGTKKVGVEELQTASVSEHWQKAKDGNEADDGFPLVGRLANAVTEPEGDLGVTAGNRAAPSQVDDRPSGRTRCFSGHWGRLVLQKQSLSQPLGPLIGLN